MAASTGNDVREVTLGTGVLTLNGVNVGFLKGEVMVALHREAKTFEAGVPLVSLKRVIFREQVTLKAGLAQIYTDKLQYALGAGVITSPVAGQSRMDFGGDSGLSLFSLSFTHNVPNSLASITLVLYKAAPNAPIDLGFKEEDFLTYNSEWLAIADTTKAPGQQYGYLLFNGFETGS